MRALINLTPTDDMPQLGYIKEFQEGKQLYKRKEIVNSFLRKLAAELRDHSSVRDQINIYQAINYSLVKDVDGIPIKKAKVKDYSVNHYRRLKRAFNKNGKEGILNYLFNLKQRFRVDKKEFEGLEEEKKNNLITIHRYFDTLIKCVRVLVLPIRNP